MNKLTIVRLDIARGCALLEKFKGSKTRTYAKGCAPPILSRL